MIGTYSLHGQEEILEYRELEGNCRKALVLDYLERLFVDCKPERLTVVVLDNATFHKGADIQARREAWEAGGMYLRFLPAYCPELNLIEGVWRLVKGFLMPRRCYPSFRTLKRVWKNLNCDATPKQ